MKIMTDQNMRTVNSISADSVNSDFPALNLLDDDPDLLWKAAAFSAAVNIVLDLATAQAIDYIWLNNANFTSVTIQANDTNTWTSPAVSESVTLADDDVGIYKGFFALSETNYRYVRVSIPVQSLLFSDSVPWLGNIILGEIEELYISSWEPQVIEEFNSFKADGGAYTKDEKGKARHVMTASMTGVTKAEMDNAPLKRWTLAVVFTDLGSVGDSFLVYKPAGKRPRVRSQIDCDLEFVLEERV